MNQIVLFALVVAVMYLLMRKPVPHEHDNDDLVDAVHAAQMRAHQVSTRAVRAANYRADEAYRAAQRAHSRAESAVDVANAAAQRAAEDALIQSRRRERRRRERRETSKAKNDA